MGRRIEIIGMVVVLLLSAIAISIVMEEGADAVGEPEILIQLNQAKQTAYVEPGQDGILTFTGNIFVEIPYSPGVQYLVVQLEVDAGNFPVSVPPALSFSKAQKQQSFSLSVQIPIGTSASDSYEMIVGGTWSYSPGVQSGECEPTSSLIFIKQYYSVDLSSEDLFSEGLRGEVAEIEIEVDNTGNGEDEIILEVLNSEELIDDGIEPYFSDGSVRIPENGSKIVVLFLKVSKGTSRGDRDVGIRAYSKVADELGDVSEYENITIFFEVVDQLSDPEPGTDPEPEPEPQPDPDPDPEPDPEDPVKEDPVVEDPVIEDPEIDNNLGTGDQESDGSSSIAIPIVIIIVVVLLVGLCVGIYFFIRSTGNKRK